MPPKESGPWSVEVERDLLFEMIYAANGGTLTAPTGFYGDFAALKGTPFTATSVKKKWYRMKEEFEKSKKAKGEEPASKRKADATEGDADEAKTAPKVKKARATKAKKTVSSEPAVAGDECVGAGKKTKKAKEVEEETVAETEENGNEDAV